MAAAALDDGRALRMMSAIIEAQGGNAAVLDDPAILPQAPRARRNRGAARGTAGVHGRARDRGGRRELGAGRRSMLAEIDPAVGFHITVKPGDEVAAGQPLASVYARDTGARRHRQPGRARGTAHRRRSGDTLPLVVERITIGLHRDDAAAHIRHDASRAARRTARPRARARRRGRHRHRPPRARCATSRWSSCLKRRSNWWRCCAASISRSASGATPHGANGSRPAAAAGDRAGQPRLAVRQRIPPDVSSGRPAYRRAEQSRRGTGCTPSVGSVPTMKYSVTVSEGHHSLASLPVSRSMVRATMPSGQLHGAGVSTPAPRRRRCPA
jgi:hypothetical protein